MLDFFLQKKHTAKTPIHLREQAHMRELAYKHSAPPPCPSLPTGGISVAGPADCRPPSDTLVKTLWECFCRPWTTLLPFAPLDRATPLSSFLCCGPKTRCNWHRQLETSIFLRSLRGLPELWARASGHECALL